MKKITTMGAQGDVLFLRVGTLPEGLTRAVPSGDNHVVVAHSETGHHHFLEAVPGVRHYISSDPLTAYLTLEETSDVIHARPFHTHETLQLEPGVWKVIRQREYTPSGYQRVED